MLFILGPTVEKSVASLRVTSSLFLPVHLQNQMPQILTSNDQANHFLQESQHSNQLYAYQVGFIVIFVCNLSRYFGDEKSLSESEFPILIHTHRLLIPDSQKIKAMNIMNIKRKTLVRVGINCLISHTIKL